MFSCFKSSRDEQLAEFARQVQAKHVIQQKEDLRHIARIERDRLESKKLSLERDIKELESDPVLKDPSALKIAALKLELQRTLDEIGFLPKLDGRGMSEVKPCFGPQQQQ